MSNSFTFNAQNQLPNGSPCVLTGYAHASYTNTATITDKSGNVVAKISGSGGTGNTYAPMNAPSGQANYFTPQSSAQPYTITFTNNGPNQSQYLFANDAINSGTTTYAESYTFVTEDASDNDYNDATVFVSWNLTGS
ncbi:MAG TPA: hypothetical protein VJ725_09835 [Thermoanaerobaculia bacterium]|nr:hypothetical protein [Thermoanaerobaculia bacterium]